MKETNNLESAFKIIQNILIDKDKRINYLEEENLKLKNKISELLNKQINKNDEIINNNPINSTNNYSTNPYSERENIIKTITTNQQTFTPPLLTPKSNHLKKEYQSNIIIGNINNNFTTNFSNDEKDSDKDSLIGSPFLPIRSLKNATTNQNITSESLNYSNYKFNNSMVPVSENHYNYTPAGAFNSPPKSNFNNSNMNDSNTSRNEVKTFLTEVRERVPPKEFKEFIKYIKILTDKNGVNLNRKETFENVRILFGKEYRDLFHKFEHLLSINK
jgi:hypothetical protein